jgi:hypothetical protein
MEWSSSGIVRYRSKGNDPSNKPLQNDGLPAASPVLLVRCIRCAFAEAKRSVEIHADMEQSGVFSAFRKVTETFAPLKRKAWL